MRIQYVSYQYLPGAGGSQLSLHDLLRAATVRGHEVEVLTEDRQRGTRAYESIPLREIPGWEQVEEGVARFGPDLILTHLNWQLVAIEAARRFKIPVVCMSRICDANPAADLMVFNSNYVARQWCQRLPGLESRSMTLYPTILADRLPQRRGQVGTAILCVNPVKVKGGKLLEAIAHRMPEQWFLAPMGWHRPQEDGIELDDLANVELLEPLPNLNELFDRSELVIFPSVWQEPFGRVIIEAMAAGLPVIASAVGGVPEAMGGAGILIGDYQNPEAWVSEIRKLQSDPARYSSMQQRSRGRACRYLQESDPSLFFERVEELVRRYDGPMPDTGPPWEELEEARLRIAGMDQIKP